MITNLEDASTVFKLVDTKFMPDFLSESIINYVDFHITPAEIQLVFLKEPYPLAKQLLLNHFTEVKDFSITTQEEDSSRSALCKL